MLPLPQMCVLAGCDFVSSLPGIGIKKAHQHLRRTRCFLKVCRLPLLAVFACSVLSWTLSIDCFEIFAGGTLAAL